MSRRATVVGIGLIGGSISLALRERGWHVSGVDTDEESLSRALELGAIDAVGWDAKSEITFVATPVSTVVSLAKKALEVSLSGVVTDAGSVKNPIVQEIGDQRFIGGHPMAGSEQEGVDGASATMFANANWVLTPTELTDDKEFAIVREVVTSFGAEVVTLSPERHDALVATVSHVPHLTAATLMGLASAQSEEHYAVLRLAAGGFRDMTRIAAGSPGIWPDICKENKCTSVKISKSNEERLKFWSGRKAAFPACGEMAPDYYCVDGTIPRSKLAKVLREITKLSKKYKLPVAKAFHAGDGNLHPIIMFDANDKTSLEKTEKFGEDILKLCVKFGGVLSGEHGIGIEKRELMCEMFNDNDIQQQINIKNSLDPSSLLNPGKVYPILRKCAEEGRLHIHGRDKSKFSNIPRF